MRKYLLLIVVIALWQCGPVAVEKSLPDGSKKLCINSYFIADSTWLVNITRGKHVLDQDPYFGGPQSFDNKLSITDATVSISKNGEYLGTLTPVELLNRNPSNGWYASDDEVAESGNTYDIVVSAPGFDDVSARCHVPSPVSLTNVTPLGNIPDNDFKLPFSISFTDRSDTEDYYSVVLHIAIKKITFPNGQEDTTPFTIEVPVYTKDPLFFYTPDSYDPLDASASTRTILFSDKGMNGASFQITGEAMINTFPGSKIEADYYMVLRTLSEDYYKYVTTRLFQKTSQNDPFSQHVQVYSNVEHGFGIFAGASQARFLVEGIE